MKPKRLYKYLPSQYVENVLSRGELLFRNLTYFKKYKGKQRGDPLEGHHRDNPDNVIEITLNSTGQKIKGDFSFLNKVDSDLIYVFCLSKIYGKSLYDEFKCDACIEITDVDEFLRRTKLRVMELEFVHKSGLLYDSVEYYASNRPAEFNIEDPKKLVFAKDEVFKNQEEYRLVFGTKKEFKREMKIVINELYDFREEAMKGTAKEKLIKIENISDIANVKYFDT